MLLLHNQWQPLKILHIEVTNKSILAQIEGYPEREQVAHLTNVEIAVRSYSTSFIKQANIIGMNLLVCR